jgi:hypothetical protein
MPVSFIQMALASMPQWLEFVLNKKYPKWREVERNEDGSARYMPAGVRVRYADLCLVPERILASHATATSAIGPIRRLARSHVSRVPPPPPFNSYRPAASAANASGFLLTALSNVRPNTRCSTLFKLARVR